MLDGRVARGLTILSISSTLIKAVKSIKCPPLVYDMASVDCNPKLMSIIIASEITIVYHKFVMIASAFSRE